MNEIETGFRAEMMIRDKSMRLSNMVEKKSQFEKLTQYVETSSQKEERKLKDIKYICKVIDSCETLEQRETAINWGLDILSRLSCNE